MNTFVELPDDLAIRSTVAAQVRHRQQVWFVVAGAAAAAVICALLVVALGVGNAAMPSLHYAPATGFTFTADTSADITHVDGGDVLLPGAGAVNCGMGLSHAGKAEGALSCDWSSFTADPTASALVPTAFMSKYGIVSGRDGGKWCITAQRPTSTAGAPLFQVVCGTQASGD